MQQRASTLQQAQTARQSFESTYFQLLQLFDMAMERMVAQPDLTREPIRGPEIIRAVGARMSSHFAINKPETKDDLASGFVTGWALSGAPVSEFITAVHNVVAYIESADECIDKEMFTRIFMTRLKHTERYILLIWMAIQPNETPIKRAATRLGAFRHPWVFIVKTEEFLAAKYFEPEAFGGLRPFRPTYDQEDQDA
jgi:hypothetical protein